MNTGNEVNVLLNSRVKRIKSFPWCSLAVITVPYRFVCVLFDHDSVPGKYIGIIF